QRADRAVDQARDQGFLLGLAAFALEEAARDAAAGVELLLVVDGEREEVLPLARGLVGDGADQQHGAVDRNHDGAAGLAGDLAGLDRERLVAVLEALGNFCHVCIPWMTLAMNRMRALACKRADRAGRSKKNRGALLRRGVVPGYRRSPSFSMSAL